MRALAPLPLAPDHKITEHLQLLVTWQKDIASQGMER